MTDTTADPTDHDRHNSWSDRLWPTQQLIRQTMTDTTSYPTDHDRHNSLSAWLQSLILLVAEGHKGSVVDATLWLRVVVVKHTCRGVGRGRVGGGEVRVGGWWVGGQGGGRSAFVGEGVRACVRGVGWGRGSKVWKGTRRQADRQGEKEQGLEVMTS